FRVTARRRSISMHTLVKVLAAAALLLSAPALPAQDGYTNTGLTLDGIGKAYMGREIAAVMSHQGAAWLDRPERAAEEGTSRLAPLLELKPTDVVADIGAGS